MITLFNTLFLGILGLALFYWYLSRNYNYWKKRGVVYRKPTIIFGNLAEAFLGKKHFGVIFTTLYQQFPDKKVVGWFNFQNPGIIVRDPELIRKVLVNDFHSFRNNDMSVNEDIDTILNRNLYLLKDEEWKRGRALLTPAFTGGKAKAMYDQMKQVAKDLVKYLKEHPDELHVKPVMSRYTSEVVARCALGIEGNNFKEPKPIMHEMGKLIFEPSQMKNLKMITLFLLPRLNKLLRLKMVPDEITKFFDSVLRDVIVHRQKNNIEKNDLVQYLIEVKRKSLEVVKGNVESEIITKVYSDEDILSGCIIFFLESYENSALILNNILYFLALHQDVQEKLRAEIDETLNEGELTFEKLNEMSYLNSVYLETQRILPVTYHMQKVCTENYEMDTGDDKPLLIEKGTSVVLPIHAVHNDPQYWEESELFKPERFTNKEEAQAKAKGIFLPFGDGPRICPGLRIAAAVVKLGVVQIVANMQIHPTKKTPRKFDPDPNSCMVAHKGGIYLKFVERSR